VLTANLGTLAPGATATVTLVVTLPAGQVGNTATVASATFDPNPGNNTATAVVTVTPAPPGPSTPPPGGTGLFAVGAGQGGSPHVKVYNADGSLRFSFFAYAESFTGGVRVATGDVDGDGTDDVITAAGVGGGPHVKVFSGVNLALLQSFYAYA